jgi:RNAse (barnase) inhibitor barstar
MRIIELDATNWTELLDFYQELIKMLGSPKWHGLSINAFVDSIVYGGINKIIPPFKIIIYNTNSISIILRNQINRDISYINEHIKSKKLEKEIEISILP